MGKRCRVSVSESESGEDSEDSDDSFIVRSDEDDDKEGEEEEEEEEEEEDEVEDEDEDAYLPKNKMREKYIKNPKLGERPGYVDSREHITQLTPEETWTHITNRLCTEAARRKLGLIPKEHGGVRVLSRFDYGSSGLSRWNSKAAMGSYEHILVPTVEELFCQKAYQPPPERRNSIPKYAFNGWKQIMHAESDQLGDSVELGDLWCICCQNYNRNRLKNVQIMQHEKSGIYLLTGGNCAAYMLGMASWNESAHLCPVVDAHDMERQFRMIMYTGRLV